MLRRNVSRVLLAATVCVLALTATGCGGGGDGPRVASAAGASSAPGAAHRSGGQSEVAQYVDAKRKYAACLRKNGLDVPDPDAKGQIDFTGAVSDKQDPTAIKAENACSKIDAHMPEVIQEELEPPATPKEAAQNRRYSRCVQDNGVPDYPDVDSKGNFPGSGTWNSTTAAARHAEGICYRIAYGHEESTNAKG